MKLTNTETGVTAEVETDLNPPVCRNSMAQAVGNVSRKLDKVYEAVAETIRDVAAQSLDSEARQDVIFVAHELVDKLEKIDPAFDRYEFLAIADGD